MNREVSAVIMAGGRGTRFWPVSTRSMPKQFLRLTGNSTMLQLTAQRFQGLCSRDDIMVVTGSQHRETVMDQLPWISEENLLLEPVGRNTAACIGWAARTLLERGKGRNPMVVVPSDHLIRTDSGFRNTVRKALEPASRGWLVTIGIKPDRPATGYGYLKLGVEISPGVYRVEAFREKPDAATASMYLESGDYLWNAGMFVWTPDAIWEELSTHLPDVALGLQGIGCTVEPETRAYDSLESISIDYGVMEKAERVVTVPAEFSWNDVGDWPSARECGIGMGEVLARESHNVTVWNDKRLTVLLGMENVTVVETDDVTLIMSDEYSQELKKVVEEIEDRKPDLV